MDCQGRAYNGWAPARVGKVLQGTGLPWLGPLPCEARASAQPHLATALRLASHAAGEGRGPHPLPLSFVRRGENFSLPGSFVLFYLPFSPALLPATEKGKQKPTLTLPSPVLGDRKVSQGGGKGRNLADPANAVSELGKGDGGVRSRRAWVGAAFSSLIVSAYICWGAVTPSSPSRFLSTIRAPLTRARRAAVNSGETGSSLPGRTRQFS